MSLTYVSSSQLSTLLFPPSYLKQMVSSYYCLLWQLQCRHHEAEAKSLLIMQYPNNWHSIRHILDKCWLLKLNMSHVYNLKYSGNHIKKVQGNRWTYFNNVFYLVYNIYLILSFQYVINRKIISDLCITFLSYWVFRISVYFTLTAYLFLD